MGFSARFFALLYAFLLPALSVHAIPSNQCSSVLLFEIPLNERIRLDQHALGPILRYWSDPTLRGPLKETLRIGTYNVLNLYEHMPRTDKEYPLEKDHARRVGNARAIHDIDPDFQILVEVENIYAAEDFNRDYLGNRYKTLLLEGNDFGRINIALLVRQNLPVDIEWRSYKHANRRVFSRDLPVGLIYERDSHGHRAEAPKFALIGTHYKSKRRVAGQEDHSAELRARQVDTTLGIIKNLQAAYGKDLPFILVGDLNADIHSSPEFAKLFQFGFRDAFDSLNLNKQERATHTYITMGDSAPTINQLDGILILSPRVEVLAGGKIPDRDLRGRILGTPKNREDRESRPSDHNAIFAEIKIHK